MPVCVLTTKNGSPNWCERHQMHHTGHYAAYAVDPGEKGERFRKLWDAIKDGTHATPFNSNASQNAQSKTTSPILRSQDLARACRHLGPLLTLDEIKAKQLAGCRQCSGKIITHHCLLPDASKFNGGPYARIAGECITCKDWSLPESNGDAPRHLLFHLWPRKLSLGTWQRNLDQLKARWGLFTGRRIIAVATSSDSHDLATVQAYMQGYECEWIETQNDPALREVKTFLPLFKKLEGFPGYTFYAQGKGVTKPVDPGVSIHHWTAAMYEILLDYWPLVAEHFKKFSIVGAFKKGIAGFTGSSSDWHYSGSFCWLDNAELWKRNWKAIEQNWFGIESWPSMIFKSEEAACLFHHKNQRFDLYSMGYWRSVEKELAKWRREKAPYRSDIGSLTIGSSR